MSEVWTVKRIVEWTASYFENFGLERPRFDTEMLLAHALGVDRLWLYTHYDRPLISQELKSFRHCVIRRAKREPLQYIIGQWGFWSLDFAVSPSVLIPRRETEQLVEYALKIAQPESRMLDLCTGCGNIVISLAIELPSASFWATDIDQNALHIAQENARYHKVSDRIHFLSGDLFAPVKGNKSGFDIILCNPPYIPTKEIERLQPEIKNFEPKGALNGGSDGLCIYRRLIPEARDFIAPSGTIIVEIGADQAESITRIFIENGYKDVVVLKDYAGLDRIVTARFK